MRLIYAFPGVRTLRLARFKLFRPRYRWLTETRLLLGSDNECPRLKLWQLGRTCRRWWRCVDAGARLASALDQMAELATWIVSPNWRRHPRPLIYRRRGPRRSPRTWAVARVDDILSYCRPATLVTKLWHGIHARLSEPLIS